MSRYEQGRRGSKITVEYYRSSLHKQRPTPSTQPSSSSSLSTTHPSSSPATTQPSPQPSPTQPPLHPQRRLSQPPTSTESPSQDPTPRSRSATTTKPKKSVFGSVLDVFKSSQRPEISTPYDPVHLTHVGYNPCTGEFTGLPKEWQQLLQESGISRSEQEKNPQAVMEIVKFYQRDYDPWDKLGNVGGDSLLADFANPVRSSLSLFFPSDHLPSALPLLLQKSFPQVLSPPHQPLSILVLLQV